MGCQGGEQTGCIVYKDCSGGYGINDMPQRIPFLNLDIILLLVC